MTNCNRATIDVELVVVDAKRIAAVKHLHRESLVQLPETDIVNTEACCFNNFGTAKQDQYPFRPARSPDCHTAIGAKRLQTQLLGRSESITTAPLPHQQL